MIVLIVFSSLLIISLGAVEEKFNSSLAPVIFLPGFSGTRLYCNVTDEKYLPASCADANIKIGQPFAVIYNVSLMLKHSDCMLDLLTLNYDGQSYHQPDGIEIFTQNFGGFSDISPTYWGFPRTLESWGYGLNRNLFGAPYDWRFMSHRSLQQIGLIAQLKGLVERAYVQSGGRRVVLVGHSNGGPTAYLFVTHPLVSREWRDTHLAAMVGLSGNYLGQMNAVRPFTWTPSSHEQDVVCGWEATYASLPSGDYAAVNTIPIVTLYNGSADQAQYTCTEQDLAALFASKGRGDWAARLRGVYRAQAMDRSAHPQVDAYCLYGAGLDTDYAYIFDTDTSHRYTGTSVMEGDGNQDMVDNAYCAEWAASNTQDKVLYNQAFPGVHHMQMVTDDAVLATLRDILARY